MLSLYDFFLIPQNDRELAEAVLSEDNTFLSALLEQRARAKEEQKRKEMDAIQRLNANPFDTEAQVRRQCVQILTYQKIIEEKIRQENVAQNMEMAIEYSPESFGRVFMLYIPVEVNGTPLQAFVGMIQSILRTYKLDSGAQQTIMSVECAQRCGYVIEFSFEGLTLRIMRLVDTNFAGMAQGVGSAPIIGRVHLAQVKIGRFTVTVN